MIEDLEKTDSTVVMDEIQLILAEKRTLLSVMRTGIAILASFIRDERAGRYLKII